MSEVNEATTQIEESAIPEDYKAYNAWRDTGELPAAEEKAPAAGEEAKPPSESPEEAQATEEGQSAAESESEEEAEQVEEPQEREEEEEKDTRLSRRMRKLTGKIAELQARLDELEPPAEAEAEVTEEVASSTEPAADEKLVRPMLRDFEDTDDQSAWDQYEAALDAYNDARTAQKLKTALAEQRQQLDLEHAKAAADEAWNKAAARYPDYNEVVREEVKISAAMESVMRMDPETGTDLAYYLGQHPEESERIAKATLAGNEREWTNALAKAGFELGVIRAKLSEKKVETPASKEAPKTAPAPQPPSKKVSKASPPPTQIRAKAVTPKTDPNSDEDAADYKKWNSAREAQLRKR